MTNFVQLVFAILNWFQSLLRVGTSAAWLNHNVNVNETRQHERNQLCLNGTLGMNNDGEQNTNKKEIGNK